MIMDGVLLSLPMADILLLVTALAGPMEPRKPLTLDRGIIQWSSWTQMVGSCGNDPTEEIEKTKRME